MTPRQASKPAARTVKRTAWRAERDLLAHVFLWKNTADDPYQEGRVIVEVTDYDAETGRHEISIEAPDGKHRIYLRLRIGQLVAACGYYQKPRRTKR